MRPPTVCSQAHNRLHDFQSPAQELDPAVTECGAIVVFFLLLVALPAGSYFYLHRSLMAQYEALAATVRKDKQEVRWLALRMEWIFL